MPSVIVTQPQEMPLTLHEVKSHLRVAHGDDDLLINDILGSAVNIIETDLKRKLITQTYDFYMSEFKETEIPFSLLQSVVSIKYFDQDNIEQTLATTVYDVDTQSEIGKVALKTGQSWPTVYSKLYPVIIRFTCGYGLSADVPKQLKSAIKIKTEALYGNLFKGERDQLEATYDALIAPYKAMKFC